jgi:protein-L-isoaspartate O-methyltransferase
LIVGVEIIPQLVKKSLSNLQYDGYTFDNIAGILTNINQPDAGKIIVLQGDGWEDIYKWGPFDAINVGAGAPYLPTSLVEQLKTEGVILIPIGEKVQGNMILTKFTKRCKSFSLETSGSTSSVDGGTVVAAENDYMLEKESFRNDAPRAISLEESVRSSDRSSMEQWCGP